MKLEVIELNSKIETKIGWALITSENYCIRATVIQHNNNEITLLLDDVAPINRLDVVTVDYKLIGQESICDLIGVVVAAHAMRATITFS